MPPSRRRSVASAAAVGVGIAGLSASLGSQGFVSLSRCDTLRLSRPLGQGTEQHTRQEQEQGGLPVLVAAAAGAAAGAVASRGPRRETRGLPGTQRRASLQPVEVQEDEALELERELAEWGEDEDYEEEVEELEGRDAERRGSGGKETNESDWQHWVPKLSKKAIWRVLKARRPDSAKFKEVMLALRRGDVLTSLEEYEDALSLLCRRREGWRDASIILACMWHNGFMPDHRHYALVMSALSQTRRYEKTTRLFEEMAEHYIPLSPQCYYLGIEAYSKKEEVDGALQLFKDMQSDGYEPTLEIYATLMYELGKAGSWVKSLELFEDMLARSILPTRQIFNLLVLAYGSAGEFERVLETIDQMIKAGLEPNLTTFLWGMQAAERAGEMDKGLYLYQRMKDRGLKTHPKVDQALMRIAMAGNDPDRALQFFEAAIQRRRSYDKNAVDGPIWEEKGIYKQALRACQLAAASGTTPGFGISSYEDYALQLLLDLQKAKIKVDPSMYLHAISTCEYKKSWTRVIGLLQEMSERGFRVQGERLRSAYWNAILAAEDSHDPDKAWDLFEQMKLNRVTVEPFMYERMVLLLEKNGQLARAARLDEEFQNRQLTKYAQEIMVHRKRNEWEEAIGIVQKIRDDGIRPTIKIMNTALSSLQYPGKWELVLEIMEQMRADGYELDVCTHTVAVTSMITAGELEKASEHLQVMKKEGVEPTAMTYGRLMYGLEKADQPEKALYLWDEMRVQGIDPDRVGFETAVRACSKCQFDEAVLELYDEMKVRDKNPSRETARSAALAAERLGLSATVIEGATPITPEEPEDVEVLDALGR